MIDRHPDLIPMIAFAVFFVLPLILLAAAGALAFYEKRKRPAGDETGDPINPQALKDWRKANWRP